MTVILVNPPSVSAPIGLNQNGKSFIYGQKERLKPYQYYSLPIEHLGIMSIAAYARKKGIDVKTVNGMVAGHSCVEETWNEILTIGRDFGAPALVGFSNIDTFDEVAWLAERCRRQWQYVKIAIGNTFASLNYERILRDERFDYAVIGDGEVTFTLLAEAVLEGRPVDKIPSLAWRNMETKSSVSPINVVLDDLPWAARDELPVVLKEGFAAAVFTTRGCPYRCTFCGTGAVSDLFDQNRYRMRSIENVVDEIEYLITDFGIEFVSISDDLFITKNKFMQARAVTFADEIIRRQLKIGFMFDVRVDSIVDLTLFAHLKKAGLRRIFIGLETGSYEQLKSYRKSHMKPGENIVKKINALQEFGIEVIPGTIMFHPAVRPAELKETLKLLKATGYNAPNKLIDRINAYPGTPLYYEYAAKGYLTKDWPIGEWNFVDTSAERVYRQVRQYIKQDANMSFSDAEKFFLARVEEWENEYVGS